MENTKGVAVFVGIDAHINHCSIKAIDRQGESLLELEVPTTSRRLQSALRDLPAPLWVMVKSSCVGPFVKDCLERQVDRVVVCETRENRWIARSEDKSDLADADRLARLLRMGEFKEVFVPAGLARDRREVLRLYDKVKGDVIRVKNRIKSKYREHGVRSKGQGIFHPDHRSRWLSRIRRSHVRRALEVLYFELDATLEARERLNRELIQMVRSTREHKLLKTIPGVGPKVSAMMLILIVDASRFPGKRQLWSYAGLGVRSRWSGDASRALVGGSRGGNRLLKYAAMIAATNCLRSDNRFSRHHQKMLDEGKEPAMARRTVARKILATALSMLKSGEPYNDKADSGR